MVGLLKAADQYRRIVPAEAETVADGHFYGHLAGDVWHGVQIALGVLIVEVAGGRDLAIMDRHDTGYQLNDYCRTEHVSGH